MTLLPQIERRAFRGNRVDPVLAITNTAVLKQRPPSTRLKGVNLLEQAFVHGLLGEDPRNPPARRPVTVRIHTARHLATVVAVLDRALHGGFNPVPIALDRLYFFHAFPAGPPGGDAGGWQAQQRPPASPPTRVADPHVSAPPHAA